MVKRKFDKVLLDECLIRDGATLVGEYEELNRSSIIKYKCKCEINDEKRFTQILISGIYCKKCTMVNRQIKLKATYLEKYGVENPSQLKEFKDKKKATTLKNYGVENPSQSKEIHEKKNRTTMIHYGVKNPFESNIVKEKSKKTNLLKYGVEYNSQSKEVKDKIKETSLKKYGVECPLQDEGVKNKGKNTNLVKYGVEHRMQNNSEKEKQKKTNLIRYGVEYASQSNEIMEKIQKNAKKYKEYKMPSGTIRKVQGYEPFALDELIKTYTEEQIKSDRKDVPRISYRVEEKQKYYFPDIFIPHENKIIEVKSTWTYNCKEDNIKAKAEACKSQGYKYETWIYNGKGGKEIIV